MMNTDLQQELEALRTRNENLEARVRELEDARRVRADYMGHMAHELRTPLNGILGFAQLMHDGKLGAVGSVPKEYLADIVSSAFHLLTLINGFCEVGRSEEGAAH
jgi:signal transduction histidine kinase